MTDASLESIKVSFDPETARLVNDALGEDKRLAQADAAAGHDSLLPTIQSPKEDPLSCLLASHDRIETLVESRQDDERVETSTQDEILVEAVAESMPDTQMAENDAQPTTPFVMGDHVYQWCNVGLIPAVYQHHGIVLDVRQDGDAVWTLQIADFSAEENSFKKSSIEPSQSSTNKSKKSLLRIYETPAKDWNKVNYRAGFWKRTTSRSGTCTAASCDAPGLVRARVQFLVDHPEFLPSYNLVESNCECVAVWCKTGTWGTVQATSWLSVTAAGQAKSAATLAGVAATTQVTVPAAGLWGWLGYTAHVSLVSTQPYLLPAIAAYGVVTAGAPALMLLRSKQQWKERTISLNKSFWESAVENPDVFVECITHWSSQHEPVEL